MSRTKRLISFYRQIGRVYARHSPTLILLSIVVFVPLGLLDAVWNAVDVDSLKLDSGFKIAAVLATLTVVAATGLIGEVFYSGAAALSLTTPEGEKPPSLREIGRRLRWWRLIGIDLLYVVIVVVGLILFLVPGVAAFVFFGLSGPIVELEHKTVRGSLRRSFDLVRGNFWFVFWVLVPIELIGDLINESLEEAVHHLLGESFFSSWLAEAAANIVTSPIVAIAAVLLTLHLILLKDGDDALPAASRFGSRIPSPA